MSEILSRFFKKRHLLSKNGAPAKALVCGWFSFENGGGTAGDTMVLNVLGEWLRENGVAYDVAEESAVRGQGVDWTAVDPGVYSHLIFVCGPIVKASQVQQQLFERFRPHSRLIGINVSLIDKSPGLEWNPFDIVLARDGATDGFPDMAFLAKTQRVPVIGLILRGRQNEYGDERCLHEAAEARFSELTQKFPGALLPIDTRVPNNHYGLRTPDEVESMISRCDLILTTRLHGAVLALKNSVPALAIDQIKGGAKLFSVLNRIEWPFVYKVNELEANDPRLIHAFDEAQSSATQRKIRHSVRRASALLKELKKNFGRALDEASRS